MAMKCIALALGLLTALTPGHAISHETRTHAKASANPVRQQKPWGIAGDARKVTRTIEITMGDDMRFKPDRIEVRRGETVRFAVRNKGLLLHEFVIGTKDELARHAALMARFPGMEHDEPYMAHVDAGKAGGLVWNFSRAGEFDFACLIAGHYEAGMVGKIIVRP